MKLSRVALRLRIFVLGGAMLCFPSCVGTFDLKIECFNVALDVSMLAVSGGTGWVASSVPPEAANMETSKPRGGQHGNIQSQ